MPQTDDDPDPLEQLRSRIRATQEAAGKLAGEATRARHASTPPAGWATAEEHGRRTEEVRALVTLLESFRELIPEDLIDQFRDLVRQLLLLLRALIDWWVERIDAPPQRGGGEGPAVQDIPIA
jgi:hypothetical protein